MNFGTRIKFATVILSLAVSQFVFAQSDANAIGRVSTCFNDDWFFATVAPEDVRAEPIRFFKIGDQPPREKTRRQIPVRLPHDWAIDSGFDANLDGATGKTFWRGVGVYSKTLHVIASDLNKRFVLHFDGAMSFPEVTVNGRYAGGWDYGYLGFEVDATPFLQTGDNLIEVRCDTREHRSRWYPGAGIYRGVELIVCSRDVWLPEGSVWVTTPEVSPRSPNRGDAIISVSVTPEITKRVDKAEVNLTISERSSGSVAFSETLRLDLEPNLDKNSTLPQAALFPQYEDKPVCEFKAELSDVSLWDVESPTLYDAVVEIRDSTGAALDSTRTTFGIRHIEWTVDDGFYLNGRRLQLHGVDLHHDQGLIGACSHPTAVRRQLQIMRDMGVNAIRTSHNPNSSAFMDVCDEMGFVVWNELFDKWDGTAGLRQEDDFFAFSARQARQFVRRDRNRPSVCAWSIGNEIASIESNREDASNPERNGKKRVQWLYDAVKRYDSTRLIGQGCFVDSVLGDYPPKVDSLSPLDITGWNYGAKYRTARKSYPETPMVYTESSSAFSTRGYYDLVHPSKKDQYDFKALQVDSYDLISANGPRDIPDVDFERMTEDRYIAGEFVWTGFDYIGEPAPFEKEAKVSYFGIVDICGVPKDRFFLYRSHWNDKSETVHILPHWNWEGREGERVPVYVYTSGDSVELFLNGKSLGRKSKDLTRTLEKPKDVEFDLPDYYWIVDKYRLRWEDAIYEPGVLQAVAYQDGREIGRAEIRTAGEVAALRAVPEKSALSGEDDLLYIEINAVDSNGTVCPNASTRFSVETSGGAVLAGLGNGNPIDMDSFADSTHSLFYGSATLILRSLRGSSGSVVQVRIVSEGLEDVTLEIPIE